MTPTSRTPEYTCWLNMTQRCRNKKNPDYGNYGGRGITVCEKWQSFANFIADMGPRPSTEYSIERKNNDLGYFALNCKWGTPREQGRNRRNVRTVEFRGHSKTIPEWARELKLHVKTLRARIRCYGWPVEVALLTPTLEPGMRP